MKNFINRIRKRLIVTLAGKFLTSQLYRGLLGRKASKQEIFEGESLIRRAGHMKPLIKKLMRADEFKAKCFRVLAPEITAASYRGILGREARGKDLRATVAWLRENKDTASLLRLLVESQEFKLITKSKLQPPSAPSPTFHTTAPKPGQGRLIIVSSNCQTGGLAAALQAYFPKDRVVPLPIPDISNLEMVNRFIENLEDADVWVSILDLIWARSNGFGEKIDFQFVKIPAIVFPAFHPDLCYARNIEDGKHTIDHYNSAIGVWAYNKGMTIGDTKRLYNRETYANLGYFNLWEPSVELLRNSFADCELDFPHFMLAVKRTGLFMYSFNHPMIHVLIEIARLVSIKIGCPSSIFGNDIKISDGLISGAIWPLYPEIADEFSLADGSYDWKLRGMILQGLEQYLEHAFREYENQKIPRNSLKMENRDEALYDRVLGPQADLMT